LRPTVLSLSKDKGRAGAGGPAGPAGVPGRACRRPIAGSGTSGGTPPRSATTSGRPPLSPPAEHRPIGIRRGPPVRVGRAADQRQVVVVLPVDPGRSGYTSGMTAFRSEERYRGPGRVL